MPFLAGLPTTLMAHFSVSLDEVDNDGLFHLAVFRRAPYQARRPRHTFSPNKFPENQYIIDKFTQILFLICIIRTAGATKYIPIFNRMTLIPYPSISD